MLVSPTEHKLASLGKASSLPEKFGADFLMPSVNGLVGVQRKEIKDLVASLHDGRFAKELGQMGGLAGAILLIEGEMRWSRDGQLISVRSPFSLTHFLGVQLATQSKGVWILRTSDLTETRLLLPLIELWLKKHRHGSLMHRPNATGEWGNVGNKDWGVHFLQSFAGIGVEVAGRIYDHFGGVPVEWTVTMEELQEVKGVGKGRAETMMRALGQTS